MTKPEGRSHLRGGYWLVFLLLGLVILAGIGEYGPLASPSLGFPVDTISAMVVGLVAYYWAAAIGFKTPELAQIEAECIRVVEEGRSLAAEFEATGRESLHASAS